MKNTLLLIVLLTFAIVILVWAQTDYYETSPHGNSLTGVLRDPRFGRGECGHCHLGHKEITPEKLLLFTQNNNNLCYTCHSSKPVGYPAQEEDRMPIGSSYPGYFEYNSNGVKIPGVENRKRWPGQLAYENSGYSSSGKFFSPHRSDLDMPRKDNNNSGMCVNCHNPHGTKNPFDMLDTTYLNIEGAFVGGRPENYELCFKCHSTLGPTGMNPEGKRIGDFYDKLINNDAESGHQFKTTFGYVKKGDKLPCYDCHNPHGSQGNDGVHPNAYLLSDQRLGWSGLDSLKTSNFHIRKFCFGCHKSSDGQGGGSVEGVSLQALPNSVLEHSFNDQTHCYDCHGRDYSSPTARNIHHPASGGDCISCHAEVVTGPSGTTRRVITGPGGDFVKLAHHVSNGTSLEVITKYDCGVCHLEGDPLTGRTSSTYHKNGVLDLRNPDTGGPVTSFIRFTRDTLSSSLESWVTEVQNNFCLKCHDADGASSALARTQLGTPQRPFTSQTKDAQDIYSLLLSSNNFHHAVLVPGSNPYCTPTPSNGNVVTMNPPWNQTLNSHNKISCFDCHAVNGHGGNFSGMLRRETYYKDPVVNSSFANAQKNFCSTCHKLTSYYLSSNGSRFPNHDERPHLTVADGGRNKYGCRGCHAGIYDDDGNLACDNGSGTNSIHGGNFTWPVCSKSSGSISKRFMQGGYLSGWADGSAGNASCWGGSCHHNNGVNY